MVEGLSSVVEDHSAHACVEFKAGLSWEHCWFIEVDDHELFCRYFSVCPSEDRNLSFIRLSSKSSPRKRGNFWSSCNGDWFPNIGFRLIPLDDLLRQNRMVRLFSISCTTDSSVYVNKVGESDHGKVWACALHRSTLDPLWLNGCSFSFFISPDLSWSEIWRKVNNFDRVQPTPTSSLSASDKQTPLIVLAFDDRRLMHVSCSTHKGQCLRNIARIVFYSILRNQIESESEYLRTSNAVFVSTRNESLELVSSVRLWIDHSNTCSVVNWAKLTIYITHLPTATLLEVIK